MAYKVGDTVKVIAGHPKGRTGKATTADTSDGNPDFVVIDVGGRGGIFGNGKYWQPVASLEAVSDAE